MLRLMRHIVFLMLCLASLAVSAVPASEGFVTKVEDSPELVGLESDDIVWKHEVKMPATATFFRIHFDNITVPPGADFQIEIHGRNDELLAAIRSADLGKGGSYWTGELPGSYALIEVRNASKLLNKLQIRIAEAGIQADGIRFLSIHNLNNPNDILLYKAPQDPRLAAAARSVAKLTFIKNKTMFSCTGFLVSANLMLTNQHCFDDTPACDTAVAIFGYEQDSTFVRHVGEEQHCVRVETADSGLDFSLIRLTGDPGLRWGHLEFADKVPPQGTDLVVVHHPGGRPKHVTIKECSVTGKAPVEGTLAGTKSDIDHLCDTEDGSSGSPVFNRQYRVVALHHLGYNDMASPASVHQNRAVLIGLVKNRIAPFLP